MRNDIPLALQDTNFMPPVPGVKNLVTAARWVRVFSLALNSHPEAVEQGVEYGAPAHTLYSRGEPSSMVALALDAIDEDIEEASRLVAALTDDQWVQCFALGETPHKLLNIFADGLWHNTCGD